MDVLVNKHPRDEKKVFVTGAPGAGGVGLTQGVWHGKSLYLPIQVPLSTVHKEIYKNCLDTDHTEISLKQFKFEPHPH